MMIYENKRTGDKVKVEASSLLLDVVEVTYTETTKHQVGETQFIKIRTFKRWWKLVDEIEDVADDDIKNDISVDNISTDKEAELTDEQYAEIGLEIAEQAKKKSKSHKKTSKAKTPKIDRTSDIEAVVEAIHNLGDFVSCEYFASVKCYKLKRNGKTFAEVYPRKKEIEVRVKEILDGIECEYKDGYKYYLPVHYFISYESQYISLLEDILL